MKPLKNFQLSSHFHPSLPTSSMPSSTPNFTLGPLLGRGSTATVSLASSSSSSPSLFAVKSSPLPSSSPLRHEHTILSSLPPSPHIITYLGFHLTPHSFHLLLEFAPLGPLSHHLPFPLPSTQSHTLTLLLALSHLHSSCIAHCDLKPDNILILADGSAKLADFGAATSLYEHTSPKFMGTPMYMAPEVARGEAQGAEADVWALGCVVIEMLTGKPPWPEERDVGGLLYRVGFTEAAPEVPGGISEEGRDFLDKCLRRERRERWSVGELLLHPFVSGSVSGLDLNCKWTSPKSTLDQSFWDSVEEENMEIESNSRNGIEGLFSSSGPDWSWDENWVAVRGNYSEISGVISMSSISSNHDDNSVISYGSDNYYSCSVIVINNKLWLSNWIYYCICSGFQLSLCFFCHLTHCFCWQSCAFWRDQEIRVVKF